MNKDLFQTFYGKLEPYKRTIFFLFIFLIPFLFFNKANAQAPRRPQSIIVKFVCGDKDGLAIPATVHPLTAIYSALGYWI